LKSRREAALRLPHFHERNFGIPSGLQHAVWIDSGQGPVRREMEDAQLSGPGEPLVFERTPRAVSWTPDNRSGDLVLQRAEEYAAVPPSRLIVVVDASAAMRDAIAPLVRALKGAPPSVALEVIIAADDAPNDSRGLWLNKNDGLQRLLDRRYAGGHDNVEALAHALDRVAADKSSALLWIHGPQPVLLGTLEPLLQRLERAPVRSTWYTLQVRPGNNRILEQLDGKAPIVTLQMNDLERLVSGWHPGATELRLRRERVKSADARVRPEDKTSDHLARLWAYGEIRAFASSADPKARHSAIELAQRLQRVTHVWGACVLATQRQYDEADLQPVEAGSVATVPEPEVGALLAVALLILLYTSRRHRRRADPRLAA